MMYADLVSELMDLVDDVDDRAAAHLRLAADGLEATVDVDEDSWPILLDDVEYHLQEAEVRIEDSDRLYHVRQIQSLVQAGRNLSRREIRSGRDA